MTSPRAKFRVSSFTFFLVRMPSLDHRRPPRVSRIGYRLSSVAVLWGVLSLLRLLPDSARASVTVSLAVAAALWMLALVCEIGAPLRHADDAAQSVRQVRGAIAGHTTRTTPQVDQRAAVGGVPHAPVSMSERAQPVAPAVTPASAERDPVAPFDVTGSSDIHSSGSDRSDAPSSSARPSVEPRAESSSTPSTVEHSVDQSVIVIDAAAFDALPAELRQIVLRLAEHSLCEISAQPPAEDDAYRVEVSP